MNALFFVLFLAIVLVPLYSPMFNAIKQALVVLSGAFIGFIVLYLMLTFVV